MEMSVTSKVEIRKHILEQRKQVSPEQRAIWDKAILEQLKAFGFPGKEPVVCCYVSVRGETGTDEIIRWLHSLGVRVALPRVCGKTMGFYYCDSLKALQPGAFGIPEPGPDCIPVREESAPVIVPGVAFSESFHRIGYGAGYYDRFFAEEPLHPRIAICYGFQLFRDFPADPYDKPMHAILTPTDVFSQKWMNTCGIKL